MAYSRSVAEMYEELKLGGHIVPSVVPEGLALPSVYVLVNLYTTDSTVLANTDKPSNHPDAKLERDSSRDKTNF